MSWLSEVIHHPDPASLSALAACAAASVALIGATFQFFIGRRQARAALISAQAALMSAKNAGRHKTAEFRQAWINKVIDTICEHNTLLVVSSPDDPVNAEEQKTLFASRLRLALLLNPYEDDTRALLDASDAIRRSKPDAQRGRLTKEMLLIAHRLLKREWVRIKDELSHTDRKELN
jgi:hypothetical protein